MLFRKLMLSLSINTREEKIIASAWVYVILWFGMFIFMILNWNDLPIYVRLLLFPMVILSPDYDSIKQLIKGEFIVHKNEGSE